MMKKIDAEKMEAKYRLLIEAIPDMVFRMDSKGVFLEYKADRSDMYHQEEGGIIGLTYQEVLPGNLAKQIERHIQLASQTEDIQIFEYQLDIPEKGLQDYEARIIPHEQDEIIAIIRNITQQKKNARRLAETEANQKAILESSMDSVWMVNPDLVIEYINQRFKDEFYRVFGVRLDIGMNIIDRLPQELKEIWKERYEKVLRNESLFIEDEIHGKENITYIEVAMRPVTSSGKVIGVAVSGRDISHRKRTEESLKASTVKLR